MATDSLASSPAASMPSSLSAVWLDPRDDVATALRSLDPGTTVDVRCGDVMRATVTRETIPLGHKIALHAVDRGTRVRKYGAFIGRLTHDVAAGGWIHTHNLATAARRTTAEELAWREQAPPPGGARQADAAEAAAALAASSARTARFIAHRSHGYILDTTAPSGASAFADLGGLPGEPVATAVDADSHVWVAMWGAGVLLRYAPDGGLLRVVRLPASRPTMLAFDSTGATNLYVATSKEGLSDAELAREPLAGTTLLLEAGVAGVHTTQSSR